MRRIAFAIFFCAAFMTASGCSSVATPLLRHETGEVLGMGRYKVSGRFDTGRMYPLLPGGSPGMIAQGMEVFQGGLLGGQASIGVIEILDANFSVYPSLGGGGWRFGVKGQVIGQNEKNSGKYNLAVGIMAGIGRQSVRGSVSYATPTGSIEADQTLSASVWDMAFPVSFRFNKTVALYSALTFLHADIEGSSALAYVRERTTDAALSLGVRINIDRWEIGTELAAARIHDPLTDVYRLVPFIGVSAGYVLGDEKKKSR